MKTSCQMKWVRPRIVDVESLPAVLGNCVGGSTDTGQTCQNGEATPATAGHDCLTGGATKGRCVTGGGGTLS